MNVAVLVVVFNRPLLTARVIDAVKTGNPARIYFACDGPREGNTDDLARVEEVRDLVRSFSSRGNVKTLFHPENLGCGRGVKAAIDWFFSHEESGVILEDDTVPHDSFFPFCQELLEKYRFDHRVGMISGTNHLPLTREHSYFFSRNKACWGWATWKRAWDTMDFEMEWRKSSSADSVLANMATNFRQRAHWASQLERIDNGEVDVWDWRWYFSMASENFLSIFPAVNLVANTGFGADSTHTRGVAKKAYVTTREMKFPLEAPPYVAPDFKWDVQFERSKMKLTFSKTLPSHLRKKIRWLRRMLAEFSRPRFVTYRQGWVRQGRIRRSRRARTWAGFQDNAGNGD